MFKEITHRPETMQYLNGLKGILDGALDHKDMVEAHGATLELLNKFVALAEYKIRSGISDSFFLDQETGILSYTEFSKILAETANMGGAETHTYSPDEIQARLIDELDSLAVEGIEGHDVSWVKKSLANRYYLTLLSQLGETEQVVLRARLGEEGHDSDLVKMNIAGFRTNVGSYCSCDIELYYKKKKMSRNRVKYGAQGACQLAPGIEEAFKGWLGIRSNEVFHILSQEKWLVPKSVKRTVVGPFYQRHLLPNGKLELVDPNMSAIIEKIVGDPRLKDKVQILSLHTDISTMHSDFYVEEGDEEDHVLNMEHKYLVSNPDVHKALLKLLSPMDVVLLGGEGE